MLDGKVGERSIVKSELQRWYPPPVSIKAHVGWALMNKHLIMYWHIRDLWGPTNLVVLCVTEMEAILPYLIGVHRDSAWDTHGCSLRYRVEDVH
jgi:hypothetical protein